jgi:GntR family transcriptional regulator
MGAVRRPNLTISIVNGIIPVMTSNGNAAAGPLDKESGVPLHVQLKTVLCQQITSGRFPAHARLPSERELCEQYGVSRITVRRALSEMAHEGLVYSSVGKGTYVSPPKVDSELQPLTGFTEEMAREGMQVSSRVLDARIIPADVFLADRLRIPRGAEVVKLQRLRLADGQPYVVQVAYLPHALCPGLLRFDFAERSLFEVLRSEYGLRLVRADTVIEAALAQREEARLLQCRPPQAVLVTEQVTYLDSGAVIELARSVFRGDRYKFHTRMP